MVIHGIAQMGKATSYNSISYGPSHLCIHHGSVHTNSKHICHASSLAHVESFFIIVYRISTFELKLLSQPWLIFIPKIKTNNRLSLSIENFFECH